MYMIMVCFLVQFNRFDPDDDLISERDFAASLLDYAQLPAARKTKMLKRVRKAFRRDDEYDDDGGGGGGSKDGDERRVRVPGECCVDR